MEHEFAASPHRCLLVLLDGIGDRSYQEFGFQTPLQAAVTPNLDKIAASSANGLYHATFAGQPLSSETAHFIMFGYDLIEFPGRGALEAIGENISLAEGDAALLSHFVTLQPNDNRFILEEGKPALTSDEFAAFSKAIRNYHAGEIALEFIPTGGIRGILKIVPNASPAITDTDPFFNGRLLIEPVPLNGFESHRSTIKTASALKEYLIWVCDSLEKHPLNRERRNKGLPVINGLVTQRAGRAKWCVPFQERNGVKGLSVSSGPMYKGLCRHIQMDFIPGHDSGDPETDLLERIKQAESALDQYDFIHVHTKWPDKAAHLKKPDFKKNVIESLDRAIGKGLDEIKNDPRTLLVIAADHSSPSAGPLVHSGEPVPIMFHGTGVRRDGVKSYNEVSAANGSLGFLRGKEFIASVLNAINKAKLQGIMQTPIDRPVWTTSYQPLQRS